MYHSYRHRQPPKTETPKQKRRRWARELAEQSDRSREYEQRREAEEEQTRLAFARWITEQNDRLGEERAKLSRQELAALEADEAKDAAQQEAKARAHEEWLERRNRERNDPFTTFGT
jgi:colicin import membrane protein